MSIHPIFCISCQLISFGCFDMLIFWNLYLAIPFSYSLYLAVPHIWQFCHATLLPPLSVAPIFGAVNNEPYWIFSSDIKLAKYFLSISSQHFIISILWDLFLKKTSFWNVMSYVQFCSTAVYVSEADICSLCLKHIFEKLMQPLSLQTTVTPAMLTSLFVTQ